jgi:hypothetical protein
MLSLFSNLLPLAIDPCAVQHKRGIKQSREDQQHDPDNRRAYMRRHSSAPPPEPDYTRLIDQSSDGAGHDQYNDHDLLGACHAVLLWRSAGGLRNSMFVSQVLLVLLFGGSGDALFRAEMPLSALQRFLSAFHLQVIDDHVCLHGDKGDDQQDIDDVRECFVSEHVSLDGGNLPQG